MILIIKTNDEKTDITDDRGNVFATLYGVRDVRIEDFRTEPKRVKEVEHPTLDKQMKKPPRKK
jgi:hypothetical protein